MDEIQKIWMFHHWLSEQKDLAELAKNHALFVASFDHAEIVKKMIDGPDHMSTDEDFEETTKMVRDAIQKDEIKKKNKNRKRKKIQKG